MTSTIRQSQASTDPCERFERAVARESDNPQLHCYLAACQWRHGRLEAHASFCKAIDLAPGFAMAHAALAAWYLQQGLVEQADQSSRRAIELAPADSAVLQSRAGVLEAMGELDPAWQLIEGLVHKEFTPVPVIRLYGRMARYRGRTGQALALVLNQLAESSRSPHDQACLHFTAADLLDSLAQYDSAFAHAQQGNQLIRPAYDPKLHERTFDTLIAYFTPERLKQLPRAQNTSDKPVFIVGMPRSGSTLVEQILASHPAVYGCGELDFMSHIWTGLAGMLSATTAQYPQFLDRMTQEHADGMAEIYLQPLQAQSPTAQRLTDKLPLNFLHLGLISLLLPGARVIDCRRDPRDTCLSCYIALFEAGNQFKFDLNHTAHFYQQYGRLMQHWSQAIDLPILEISYEKLVTDPETQTRRTLEFLNLPWDPACLNFHQTRRSITTSSLQQARQPVYATSIGRWRHYQRHLVDLDHWFPYE